MAVPVQGQVEGDLNLKIDRKTGIAKTQFLNGSIVGDMKNQFLRCKFQYSRNWNTLSWSFLEHSIVQRRFNAVIRVRATSASLMLDKDSLLSQRNVRDFRDWVCSACDVSLMPVAILILESCTKAAFYWRRRSLQSISWNLTWCSTTGTYRIFLPAPLFRVLVRNKFLENQNLSPQKFPKKRCESYREPVFDLVFQLLGFFKSLATLKNKTGSINEDLGATYASRAIAQQVLRTNLF